MDGHFSGYASVFGVPDLGRDVVVPGAFAASLARRGAAGVRLLLAQDLADFTIKINDVFYRSEKYPQICQHRVGDLPFARGARVTFARERYRPRTW